VGNMTFTRRQNRQGILIQLKIEKKYAKQITASSRATVKTMGILGDKYVDISLGKLSEPPLKPGDFVSSEPIVDTSALLADAASSVARLNQLLRNLTQLSAHMVQGNGTVGALLSDPKMAADVRKMVRQTRQATAALAQGRGTAGKFLQDSLLYRSLLHSSQQLEVITRRMRDGKGTVGKLMADSTLYTRLISISAQSDSLLKKLQGKGTFGRLTQDPALYKEWLAVAKALRALTEDIQKHPKKYGSFSVF